MFLKLPLLMELLYFSVLYVSSVLINELAGKSNFTAIYKGSLRNGSTVVVKCIAKTSCKSDESKFLQGLKILTLLKNEKSSEIERLLLFKGFLNGPLEFLSFMALPKVLDICMKAKEANQLSFIRIYICIESAYRQPFKSLALGFWLALTPGI
ncbi:hypothetical protein V6N13_090947 [Hibiscus sabdariffa]|uniref:Protein kinase domain-containing protein n=1 Tax=Hibiscus sabdariffa TaxID=183260 RepID=A0ABR2PBL2_9ROSI